MVELTEEQKAEIEKAKQEAVAKAVAEKEAELTKKHNEEMANLRIKTKAEKDVAVKKAEENAKLSAEEKAKKKLNDRKAKLVSAGVPEMFANDSRLINAEEDKVEETINTIKTEWEKIAPKGATTTTNVNGKGSSGETDKFKEFRGLGVGRRR